MSFRQQNKNPDTVWRRSFCQKLLAAGLPDFIIDDERRWSHLLLHGYDLESSWSPAEITKTQAVDLLGLLESHYKRSSGLWLFDSLDKRIDDKLRA